MLLQGAMLDSVMAWRGLAVRLRERLGRPSGRTVLTVVAAGGTAAVVYKVLRLVLDAELTEFEATSTGFDVSQPASRQARMLASRVNACADELYEATVRWGVLARFRRRVQDNRKTLHRVLCRATVEDLNAALPYTNIVRRGGE